MTTQIITEQEAKKRNAIAYLKGQIIGYAVKKGIKWESTKEQTEFFHKGFESAQVGYADEYWVTVRHILYNQIRHDRPHISSRRADSATYSTRHAVNEVMDVTGYLCLEAD